MARWSIEYYDEVAEGFIEFTGYNLNEIYEELSENGEPHLYFYLFNTVANRVLLQQDLLINAYYDDVLQFTGILQGGDIEDRPGKIKMVVYDDFIITLDQASSFTGAYEKPAKDIIDAILSGTGYSAHSSTPTTIIPVIFYHSNRLDAIKFMQKALACDVWHNGTTVYFATKGTGVTNTPTTISLSKRGIDRSKGQFTKVEIRGTDVTGFHILGVAGSGTKVWKGNEDQMTDEATLNSIAAKKLAELATDSSGMPVSVLMTEGKDYSLGESVAVSDARYLLNGTYRIMQMTKTKFKCNMQLDRARKTMAATVDELKGWEKKGIYTPGSEAWVLNLQGLVALFHLNEGEDTVAKNRAPIDEEIDGTITDGIWQDGPITKILTLNGTSANVSLGDSSKSGINLTGKLSFGGWFSPSANDSTKRFVCHKDGQFALYYQVNTGVLGCDIVTGTGTHSYGSDAGLVKVGGRIFAMITYDQSKVRMYYNGWLHKEWSLTGAPSSSSNTVYLGVFLKGVLAEVMLWSRALVDQEVLELYFFPLLRVVSSGGGSSSGEPVGPEWYLPLDRVGMTVIPANSGSAQIPHIAQTVKLNPSIDGAGNQTIHVTFTETASINPNIDGSGNKTIHNNLSETPTINPSVDGSGNKTIHNTITESSAVLVGAAANWYLGIALVPNPTNWNPNKAFLLEAPYMPAPQTSTIVSVLAGNSITVTADEDFTDVNDYIAFGFWIIDGQVQAGVPGPSLQLWKNSLTISAKPAGSYHQVIAIFGRAGWMLESQNPTGPGSVDKLGWDVIPAGQSSIAYTATPNPNPGDPTHPNHIGGWYLDGLYLHSNSQCVVVAQSGGQHHLQCVFHTYWQ